MLVSVTNLCCELRLNERLAVGDCTFVPSLFVIALASASVTVPAVVVGGVGTLVVVGLWLRWFPELLRREHLGARRE